MPYAASWFLSIPYREIGYWFSGFRTMPGISKYWASFNVSLSHFSITLLETYPFETVFVEICLI